MHFSWAVLKTQSASPFHSEMKLPSSSFAGGTILQILTALVSQLCNQVVRFLSFRFGQSWLGILALPIPRGVTIGKSVVLFEAFYFSRK